jgi:dimethylsulfoniopropionate demethylase
MYIAPNLALSRRLRKSPFFSRSIEKGARAFTVYNHMLLATEFDSFERDYWHLSEAVQVWDVAVERQVSIKGPDATRLVQWMTPRAVEGVALDRCVYLPLADEKGNFIHDPVGIRLADDHWWLSISDSDVILWAKGLARGANLDVQIDEPDVWPLAVQGPLAEELMARVFGDEVKNIRFFRYVRMNYRGHKFIVARSGWSKQGGFEIYVDDIDLGQSLYDELFAKGEDLNVRPGCPNIIERIENGLLAFGNDMDGRHSVLEAGLGGFVSLDKDLDSLSHEALRAEQVAGPARRLMGIILPRSEVAKPLAERPFLVSDAERNASKYSSEEAITCQGDLTSCLGSQCYSVRYRVQLATAMLEEPFASQETIEVLMADGSVSTARVSTLPFDFEQLDLIPAV